MNKNLKIVVVDDDDVQLTILRAWLSSQGHSVITQAGPLGTTGVVLREQPDVVVLDVVMPALDGAALARMLGRVASAIKVGVMFYSSQSAPPVDVGDIRVLGAIRKTNSGQVFLGEFNRLVANALGLTAGPLRGGGPPILQ